MANFYVIFYFHRRFSHLCVYISVFPLCQSILHVTEFKHSFCDILLYGGQFKQSEEYENKTSELTVELKSVIFYIRLHLCCLLHSLPLTISPFAPTLIPPPPLLCPSLISFVKFLVTSLSFTGSDPLAVGGGGYDKTHIEQVQFLPSPILCLLSKYASCLHLLMFFN